MPKVQSKKKWEKGHEFIIPIEGEKHSGYIKEIFHLLSQNYYCVPSIHPPVIIKEIFLLPTFFH